MPGQISRCGGACNGIIDSTATAGDVCGVHSVGASAGAVLTADGAGGSAWGAGGGAQEEWFQVVSVSIGGASSTQLTWSRLAGPLILDLTNPTQPTVVSDGVYSLDVTAVVTTNAATANHFQLSANAVQGVFTGAVLAQDAYSNVAADAIQAAVSTTNKMFAADSFLIQIFNYDTVARNFNCPTVRVTKII